MQEKLAIQIFYNNTITFMIISFLREISWSKSFNIFDGFGQNIYIFCRRKLKSGESIIWSKEAEGQEGCFQIPHFISISSNLQKNLV